MKAILSLWVLLFFVFSGASPLPATGVPNFSEHASNPDRSSCEQEEDSFRPSRLRVTGRGRKNNSAWKNLLTAPPMAAGSHAFSAEPPLQVAATSRPDLQRLYARLRV
jgi:hypothetical protein